jgi:hypothetical protein
MTTGDQIKHRAKGIAAQLEQRCSALEQEKLAIEARVREIQTICNTARMARKRIADFTVKRGSYYQCPRCWIENKTLSNLSGVIRDGGDHDFFVCDVCNDEFATTRG